MDSIVLLGWRIFFGLSVTIFIGSDIADQAYIFSTVNLEQTKVSKSIVYDLFELAKTRSPQKTAHNIAVALDRDERGPFYQRIKRLGFATVDRKFETITQATFVENLLPLISPDPKEDRDLVSGVLEVVDTGLCILLDLFDYDLGVKLPGVFMVFPGHEGY
jgi:DGQHR domain-containing protein